MNPTSDSGDVQTTTVDRRVDPLPPVAPPPPPPTAARPTPHDASGTTLRDVLHVIRRSWAIIVAAVVTALLAGWAVTALLPPTYETQAQVLVRPAVSGEGENLAQASAYVAGQVATYAALAETPAVLDPAISRSGVEVASTELVDDVTAEVVPDTSLITITVEAGTPTDAAELANATALSLIEQIEAQTPVQAAVTVTGSIVEVPAIPERPASPLLLLNLALALGIGLVVAFGVVVVRQALSAGPRHR